MDVLVLVLVHVLGLLVLVLGGARRADSGGEVADSERETSRRKVQEVVLTREIADGDRATADLSVEVTGLSLGRSRFAAVETA